MGRGLSHCTGGSDQDHPRKRNAKMSEDALKELRKEESKRQRKKGKIYPFECRVPKKSKER